MNHRSGSITNQEGLLDSPNGPWRRQMPWRHVAIWLPEARRQLELLGGAAQIGKWFITLVMVSPLSGLTHLQMDYNYGFKK